MRLAKPFPPCARSLRHHDGQMWIDDAPEDDFEDDPWTTVVPYMNRHLDEWNENDWKAMERSYPWASHYKFANMLEFGSLVALPAGVLHRKTLDDKGEPVRFRTSFRRRLHYEYITSSPRTWGCSQKQELVDCARHCSFLEHFPPGCPGTSPQALSYCCVRLTDDGCPFARVLCVASSSKSGKLVDGVVLVSRNEMVLQGSRFKAVMSHPDVDGRSDLVRAGKSGMLHWCDTTTVDQDFPPTPACLPLRFRQELVGKGLIMGIGVTSSADSTSSRLEPCASSEKRSRDSNTQHRRKRTQLSTSTEHSYICCDVLEDHKNIGSRDQFLSVDCPSRVSSACSEMTDAGMSSSIPEGNLGDCSYSGTEYVYSANNCTTVGSSLGVADGGDRVSSSTPPQCQESQGPSMDEITEYCYSRDSQSSRCLSEEDRHIRYILSAPMPGERRPYSMANREPAKKTQHRRAMGKLRMQLLQAVRGMLCCRRMCCPELTAEDVRPVQEAFYSKSFAERTKWWLQTIHDFTVMEGGAEQVMHVACKRKMFVHAYCDILDISRNTFYVYKRMCDNGVVVREPGHSGLSKPSEKVVTMLALVKRFIDDHTDSMPNDMVWKNGVCHPRRRIPAAFTKRAIYESLRSDLLMCHSEVVSESTFYAMWSKHF
ncbi:hypothetical protein CBR_g49730 [Chara braunii]|uniref:Uncharacterized protein n=1 Tax=Chara braunii TaxID=69332 RepID=A0A388M5Y2_CHABU|nr:hypothetical protein CBR_g49730 [Chara braunii]|eukprot:GBG89882.1 hypothetical protein CBR_g49730 [Chara braunii]